MPVIMTRLARVVFWAGGCDENPRADPSEGCAQDFGRRLRKSLSRFAKASRRSSKGRVNLGAAKIEKDLGIGSGLLFSASERSGVRRLSFLTLIVHLPSAAASLVRTRSQRASPGCDI